MCKLECDNCGRKLNPNQIKTLETLYNSGVKNPDIYCNNCYEHFKKPSKINFYKKRVPEII